MRKFALGFVAALAAVGAMGMTRLPVNDVFLRQQEMLTPTVKVELEKESGSGTVVRSDAVGTYIVTNAHVGQALGQPVDIHLWFYDGHGKSAQEVTQAGNVVAISKGVDLALIKIRDLSFRVPVVAHLAPENVTLEESEDVWVAGAALGFRVHLTQGLLSIISMVVPGFPLPHIVTSAPVISGNSGGGLYHRRDDGHFEYIGTVQAVAMAHDAPITTTNFAIPNSQLRRFFEVNGYGWLLNEGNQV